MFVKWIRAARAHMLSRAAHGRELSYIRPEGVGDLKARLISRKGVAAAAAVLVALALVAAAAAASTSKRTPAAATTSSAKTYSTLRVTWDQPDYFDPAL